VRFSFLSLSRSYSPLQFADPRHFGSMAAVAFSVAFVVSLVFAVLGYLMFVLLLSSFFPSSPANICFSIGSVILSPLRSLAISLQLLATLSR
jgi:hypothetical protein